MDTFLSGSSSRTLFISSGGSEANSRVNSKFTYDNILYYKSFGGSSMIISNPTGGMEKGSKVHNPTELTKWMVFESKEKLMSVVKKVHIANHQELKVLKSDSYTWEVGYKQNIDGYQWRLRARKKKAHKFFLRLWTLKVHKNVLANLSHKIIRIFFENLQVRRCAGLGRNHTRSFLYCSMYYML